MRLQFKSISVRFIEINYCHFERSKYPLQSLIISPNFNAYGASFVLIIQLILSISQSFFRALLITLSNGMYYLKIGNLMVALSTISMR